MVCDLRFSVAERDRSCPLETSSFRCRADPVRTHGRKSYGPLDRSEWHAGGTNRAIRNRQKAPLKRRAGL
jgi:hypothetical protein